MAGLSGVLVVDKPAGWTSHDVVARLRGIAHTRRIGHAGTLDPMATGVLVVLIGRATRAAEFAEAQVKGYEARIRFGLTTDTLDIEGRVLSESGIRPGPEALRAVLPRFTGRIEQIPPMYSAIKVGGRRLYEIARAGGEVERKAREVYITKLDCAGPLPDGDYELSIECTKGTYIRSLCADIGEALGCGACMSALRRTYSGEYRLRDAVGLETLAERGVEPFLRGVDSVFASRPELVLSGARAERTARNGGELRVAAEDGEYRVYSESGEFLLLGAVKNGVLRTVKSFFEVD